jgi:nucleoside-diphosphate-sugar epimerase
MAICEQHQVPCAWGRIFLPFGTGESTSRLIPSLIEVFRDGRAPFGVFNKAYRDFLHATDVAEAFIRLLVTESSGVYNVSSGEPTRLTVLVTTLATLLCADPEPILALAKDCSGEPHLLVGENLRLKTLGWKPALNLIQGLERSL